MAGAAFYFLARRINKPNRLKDERHYSRHEASSIKRVQRFVIFIPASGTPMFSVSTAKFKNNLVFTVDISALMWLLASGRQK